MFPFPQACVQNKYFSLRVKLADSKSYRIIQKKKKGRLAYPEYIVNNIQWWLTKTSLQKT